MKIKFVTTYSSTLFFVDSSLGRQLKSNKQLDTAYSSSLAFPFYSLNVCKYSLEVSWEQIELCRGTLLGLFRKHITVKIAP